MSWIKLIVIVVAVLIGYAYLPDNLKQGINDNVVSPIMEKTNITEEINTTENNIQNNSNEVNLNKIELGKVMREFETDCLLDSECVKTYGENSFCEGGICYVFT